MNSVPKRAVRTVHLQASSEKRAMEMAFAHVVLSDNGKCSRQKAVTSLESVPLVVQVLKNTSVYITEPQWAMHKVCSISVEPGCVPKRSTGWEKDVVQQQFSRAYLQEVWLLCLVLSPVDVRWRKQGRRMEPLALLYWPVALADRHKAKPLEERPCRSDIYNISLWGLDTNTFHYHGNWHDTTRHRAASQLGVGPGRGWGGGGIPWPLLGTPIDALLSFLHI